MENNMDISVFPLPFSYHVVFVILAVALFAFQYYRCRRTYQILIMLAIPATLLLHINESLAWHYTVGAIEAVLILAAIITSVLDGIKMRREKKSAADTDKIGTDK